MSSLMRLHEEGSGQRSRGYGKEAASWALKSPPSFLQPSPASLSKLAQVGTQEPETLTGQCAKPAYHTSAAQAEKSGDTWGLELSASWKMHPEDPSPTSSKVWTVPLSAQMSSCHGHPQLCHHLPKAFLGAPAGITPIADTHAAPAWSQARSHCFTRINSFHPHDSTIQQVLSLLPFYRVGD